MRLQGVSAARSYASSENLRTRRLAAPTGALPTRPGEFGQVDARAANHRIDEEGEVRVVAQRDAPRWPDDASATAVDRRSMERAACAQLAVDEERALARESCAAADERRRRVRGERLARAPPSCSWCCTPRRDSVVRLEVVQARHADEGGAEAAARRRSAAAQRRNVDRRRPQDRRSRVAAPTRQRAARRAARRDAPLRPARSRSPRRRRHTMTIASASSSAASSLAQRATGTCDCGQRPAARRGRICRTGGRRRRRSGGRKTSIAQPSPSSIATETEAIYDGAAHDREEQRHRSIDDGVARRLARGAAAGVARRMGCSRRICTERARFPRCASSRWIA